MNLIEVTVPEGPSATSNASFAHLSTYEKELPDPTKTQNDRRATRVRLVGNLHWIQRGSWKVSHRRK